MKWIALVLAWACVSLPMSWDGDFLKAGARGAMILGGIGWLIMAHDIAKEDRKANR